MRFLWLSLSLAVLFLVPFLIWGGSFEAWFSGTAALTWVRAWGWVAVVGLLCADLVLPLPATGIMAAAGFVYGPWIGGGLSALGSFGSGLLAYCLCRAFGTKAARSLVGPEDLERSERLFASHGAWLVALSRALPLLPEVIACLAGLARMPPGRFAVALGCGSIPMGFIYAAIGAAGQEKPFLALGLSIAVPGLLWGVAQIVWSRKKSNPALPPSL